MITGGGSGIGRAIALKFAANGATITILDADVSSAGTAGKEIQRAGGKVSFEKCDVTNGAEVMQVFGKVAQRHSLQILVNNAGVSHIGNAENTSEEDFNRVMRVNVNGYFHCIRASLGHLKTNGGGVILNIASVAGSAGLADRFAYSTSKGAIIAMTYSVARDFVSYNIRCNCISPARVHTPFVDGFLRKNYPGQEEEMYAKLSSTQPIGRMGKPEEVASLALFLCSDAAAFITGADYLLDGGFTNLHG